MKPRKALTDADGEVRPLTKEDFKRMRPASEMPEPLKKILGIGKRGPQKTPTKERVTIRLSPQVLDHFRAGGPGWQTRIDEVLLQVVDKDRKGQGVSKQKRKTG